MRRDRGGADDCMARGWAPPARAGRCKAECNARYMDQEALTATQGSGFATFYSRSKQRLWQKGETSGNRLRVEAIHGDCDGDALLLMGEPAGVTCHLGTVSCFGDRTLESPGWLADLSKIVRRRAASADSAS